MGIRLVAFDLDGTVLDDEKCLPERNRRALAACVERGILIVPCTGRLATGIPREILDIGVRYAVTINGGAVCDLKEDCVLDLQLLDKTTALAVMKLARQRPRVMCDAYADGRAISEVRYYDHLEQFGIPPAICRMIRQTRVKVPDMEEYLNRPDVNVNKINMYFADGAERELLREQLRQFPDILVTSSVVNNLEINGAGASKGPALGRLAGLLGIDMCDTMAFGDGDNDYSMIEMAGIGVAMENGEERLRAAADYVTGSNNDAGVAQAVEKLILSV